MHRTVALQPADKVSKPYPVIWESQEQAEQHLAFMAEVLATKDIVEGYEHPAETAAFDQYPGGNRG